MRSLSPLEPSQSDTAPRSSMFLHVLRAVFVLAFVSVGMTLVAHKEYGNTIGAPTDLVVVGFIGVALIVIALDIFIPRKSLTAISGLFFGLIVGMVIAFGFSLVVDMVVESVAGGQEGLPIVTAVKVGVGVICCYLSVSFILQTKDDIRFVIPYVEFMRQTKGGRPLVLDTSVIIDGRIADIADTRIIESELVVPRFVLQELQTIADSSDKLKRTRGRRGLEMLNKLQSSEKVDIRIYDGRPEQSAPGGRVDEMLIDLTTELGGRLVTNDFNLNKMAQLRGLSVININDLANALKPVVLPGESLAVKVIKPGEELGQGVGYLEDGTMVVAEGARDKIGEVVTLTITSVLQTSAGRMIFGRTEGADIVDRRRPRPPQSRPSPPPAT